MSVDQSEKRKRPRTACGGWGGHIVVDRGDEDRMIVGLVPVEGIGEASYNKSCVG